MTRVVLKPDSRTDTRDVPRIASETLFQGRREVAIEYRGETYRLRITRNDKLILTK